MGLKPWLALLGMLNNVAMQIDNNPLSCLLIDLGITILILYITSVCIHMNGWMMEIHMNGWMMRFIWMVGWWRFIWMVCWRVDDATL
jgi:hypothetical protein